MSGREPEEAVGLPLAAQRWQSLTFLHWAYDPGVVQRLLPPGLEVDTFDGAAWVGLTPFVLVGFRPLGLPAVPVVSTFPETNVRTYVRHRDGPDGLWFLSLDASRLAAVLGARGAVWAPYHWADLSVDEGAVIRYEGRRRALPGQRRPGYRIAVRPGAPVPAGPGERGCPPNSSGRPPLVDFLTGRWRAFSRIAGRLVTVPVQHQPWPLAEAAVEELDEDIVAAGGLPAPEGAPLVHFSPGVDVRLGFPRP